MRSPRLSECGPIPCEGVLLPTGEGNGWHRDGLEGGMALFCDAEAYIRTCDVYEVVWECPDCGWQKGYANPDIP